MPAEGFGKGFPFLNVLPGLRNDLFETPVVCCYRMSESPRVSTVSTFVLRFWQERSATGSRWRGRIEHVLSGDSAAFIDLDEMLEFLRRFGVTVEGEKPPACE